jgi:hypothetical protein
MRTVSDIIATQNEAQQRIGELYTVITDEVASDATLAALTSASKTAEFSLWKYVWAVMAWIQEGLFSEFAAEIDAKAKAAIPGTDYWLRLELMKFQYGDTLVVDTSTGKYYYPVIDETKKIIKRCAVVLSGGVTMIKVAKESGGNPVPLSSPELNAFASFVDRIIWAGSNVAAPVSFASDKINAPMQVYYDGTMPLAEITASVQAAFNQYLAELPFNGRYQITTHQDKIQSVHGVVDVVPGEIQIKPDGGGYSTVNRVFFTISGYIEKDPDIPFNAMITFFAQ